MTYWRKMNQGSRTRRVEDSQQQEKRKEGKAWILMLRERRKEARVRIWKIQPDMYKKTRLNKSALHPHQPDESHAAHIRAWPVSL